MDGANGRITHRELVDLGYIFLTKEQEDIVLKTVNDAFARSVGRNALDRIAGQRNGDKNITEEDIRDYLMDHRDDCEDIVSAARANILRALQERRKHLLTQMTASTETEPHGQSDTDGMDV